MAMPDTARHYTVNEVLAFPADGNRYELVQGQLLVTPAPRPVHQIVLQELLRHVHAYLRHLPSPARVFLSPADISWAEDELVQPDLFVVPADEVSASWTTYQTLLLAIEIVSPSSSHHDRITKRRLYQARGVATYWVVDPDAQLVEVWHPGDARPEIVTDVLRWKATGAAEEMEIGLDVLFGDLPKD